MMVYKYSIAYLQDFAFLVKPYVNDIKIIGYNNIKMNIVAMQSFITFRPGKKVDSVKICKTCKFYEPTRERCKLFGNMNVVTGELEYNFAAAERREQGECGPEAKYWYQNNHEKEIDTQVLPP